MFSNDFAHRCVGKALLVITEKGRSVDACENCCLSRCALWASFNTEPWICGNENAVVREGVDLVLKDCEWFCILESIERIVWASRPDAETVDEEE